MHLTQFSDFSLRVLLYLAFDQDNLFTIDQISRHFNIPRNHLIKVVNWLSRKGYIDSFRGKNGGIRLARAAKTYRLGDIVKATEPNMNLVECFDRDTNTCPIAGICELEVALYEAYQCFIERLNRYTLQDFAEFKANALRKRLAPQTREQDSEKTPK